MVVSLMGEEWSPKIPPARDAATKGARGRPMTSAAGTAMGSMMAKVPQEDPMEKAIPAETRKTRGKKGHRWKDALSDPGHDTAPSPTPRPHLPGPGPGGGSEPEEPGPRLPSDRFGSVHPRRHPAGTRRRIQATAKPGKDGPEDAGGT